LLFARSKAVAVESVDVSYILADSMSTIKYLFGVAGITTQTISGHYAFLAILEKPAARIKHFGLEPSVCQK
jgi:hypothetical protein